jgi:hypothetical protein
LETLPGIDIEGESSDKVVYVSPDWFEDEKIIHKLFSVNLTIQHLLSELRKMPGTERACIPDEFTLAAMRVRRIRADAQTPFCFRLMLAIHRIVEDVRARLRQEMASRISSINRIIEYTAIEQPRGLGPYWGGPEDGESAQLLKKFSFFEMRKINGYFQSTIMRKMLADGTATSAHPRDLEENIVQHLSPLFCDTTLLDFELAVEESGLLLANHHLSIIYTAPLYNALQQKKLLAGTWADIEDVIRTHLNAMFFGSLPTPPYKSTNGTPFATACQSLTMVRIATVRNPVNIGWVEEEPPNRRGRTSSSQTFSRRDLRQLHSTARSRRI